MSEHDAVNVARFLPLAAARQPDFPAVRVAEGRENDGTIRYLEKSFAELERESNATARLLQSEGIQRGTRVLLMVRPGLDLIRVTFALFKIGAVPVVIDPGMGMRSFLSCVERTRPQALVGIRLAHWVARFFRNTFSRTPIRVVVGTRSFQQSLSADRGGDFPVVPTRSDDPAAILFTSGSTGAPKGVCYEQGMFEGQVRLIRDQYGIQPGEIDLPMLPVFALFNPALGMTTVVPEMNPSRPATVDPAKIVQAIRQNQVTNSFGSPVLWAKIGDYCCRECIQLPSIRRILMAGAPVPPGLIRQMDYAIPNGEIHTPYGATECLPVSTLSGPEILSETWRQTESGRGTCVGHIFPEMQVRILCLSDDPVNCFTEDEVLSAGEIGEIIVSGPTTTKAYDALPEATTAAKLQGPDGRIWHRMGDVGYLDEQNRLWFCGRKAERVQTASGKTLYTDPCEAVFNTHPKVFRTALIGLGPQGRQQPALVVEPFPEDYPKGHKAQQAMVDELRALAQAHPHTQDIETFFFCRKFPVDVRHNAKIHRLTLARRFDRG